MENKTPSSSPAPLPPIPFNKPFIAGRELYHISQAVLSGHLAGNGAFTRKCQEFLETRYGVCGVFYEYMFYPGSKPEGIGAGWEKCEADG